MVEDVEEDDDDDELYEENNMTYVNCVINNDCCIKVSEELDRALLTHVVPQENLQGVNDNFEEKNFVCSMSSTVHQNSSYQSNTLYCASETQTDKNSKIGRKTSTLDCGKSTTKIDKVKDNYDIEHIYETIPEDPDPNSEPFYCSPYDSSVYVTAVASCISSTITNALQKQRVAQWLGIKPIQEICSTLTPRQSIRTGNTSGRGLPSEHKRVPGTVRSIATSLTNSTSDWVVGNNTLPGGFQTDQDNSSSAYNTGGSNNSVFPLALMLNSKTRCDQNVSLVTAAVTNGIFDDGHGLQTHQRPPKTSSPKEKCKTTSPKGGNTIVLKSTSTPTNKMPVMGEFFFYNQLLVHKIGKKLILKL